MHEKQANSVMVLPIMKLAVWVYCKKVTKSIMVSPIIKISLLIRKSPIFGDMSEKITKSAMVPPIMKTTSWMHNC